MSDPRGPLRTVASVERTPQAWMVRFVECVHVVAKTAHHAAPREGEQVRCYACRDTR